MRRHFPYKEVIVAMLILGASVALLNFTGKPKEGQSLWESAFARASLPFYRMYSSAIGALRSLSAAFAEKSALLRQNQEMADQLAGIEGLKARIAELEDENARLKDLLKFKEDSPAKYTAAEVVERNPNKWFSTISISVGKSDGVKVDDPVVSRNGLVGRVLTVQDHTSTVLLLADPESGVGAIVEGSRDYGVALGGSGSGELTLRFFSKDADVKVGDRIVTSGMGSKFPAGIPIGEVTAVRVPKSGLIKEAVVKPAADLDHLEEVMVVQK